MAGVYLLVFIAGLLLETYGLPIEIKEENKEAVFVSQQTADTVLRRLRRYNSGYLEEMRHSNLERECIEETCTLEEAREVFEDNDKAMAFWASKNDGDQCKTAPCLNRGVCKDGISTYTCYCQPTFRGKNCEIKVNQQCSVKKIGCSHFCVMKAEIPVCQCAAGYRLGPDKRRCEPTEQFSCGHVNRSHSSNSSEVVYMMGAGRAFPGEIPWQVALMSHSQPSASLQRAEVFCGGSLLSELWVATAAHCLEPIGTAKKVFFVRVGEHDVNQDEDAERDYEVAEQHKYYMYNATISLKNHDIALLKLASPVELSNLRRPICLGPGNFTENILREASSSLVSGWGRLVFRGIQSPTLKKLEVPYVERTACQESSKEKITNFMFCAGFNYEGKDACQADSGGPHATNYKGTWFLTGIISWGEECGQYGKYGVYTRVSRYHKWISETTGIPINN